MADWFDFVGKLDGREQRKRWLFTVHGTFVSMWDGPPADVARAVERYYVWQPVSYPAAVFPMRPSVNNGVTEFLRLLDDVKPADAEWALAAYSQGAVVANQVYERLRDANSRHLNTLRAAVLWGDPCREQNVANGNLNYGWPMPEQDSSGIAHASERMTDTPDWWLSFVNHGDIYAEVPRGDGGLLGGGSNTGEQMTMVYQLVMDPIPGFGIGWTPAGTALYKPAPKSGDKGKDTLIEQVTELFADPITEIPAMFDAIVRGLGFVAAPGGPTFPHVSYDIGPAIDYLNKVGDRLPIAA